MDNKDSISNTFQVAGALCIVCSLLVSITAVGLRETQKNNVVLDKKKNILLVSGFSAEEVADMDATQIESFFAKDGDEVIEIEDIVIDLTTGKIAAETELQVALDKAKVKEVSAFDQEKIEKAEGLSISLDVSKIGLKSHEKFSHVYIVKNKKKGIVTRYVFPVKGKGLWSTLFGFLAVDATFQKIEGLTFYKHGETPGLGGEVDNPKWKKLWEGRLIYADDGNLADKYVVKGAAPSDNRNAVDGLSGATITSNGVSSLVRYWLSEEGFGKYMDNVKNSSSNSKSNG